MKFISKKILSTTAMVALLSVPVASYVVQAVEEIPNEGFYIVGKDDTKHYFSTNELFDASKREHVLDIINATDMDFVYILQEGKVTSMTDLFDGKPESDYITGSIPEGTYETTDGNDFVIGEAVEEEVEEFQVIDIK